MSVSFSIVVPTYNEVESLPELFRELEEVMAQVSDSYEIVVVDDGSTDGTWDFLDSVLEDHPRIRALQLTRNFGKSAAYLAGFHAACGERIITVDADLQDDPKEIPHMLEVMDKERYDLVVGWKQNRMGNELGKALPSRVFNWFLFLLFGMRLHDSNCGFRVLRREVTESLDLYGDIYRFIPEIAHLRGYRVGEMPVQHRCRKYGQSKYGPTRFLTGLMDLFAIRFVTAFKQKPLQFFGGLSIPLFLIGGGLELYVLTVRLFFKSSFQIHVAAIMVGALFLMMGLQIFATGLIGEMLAAGSRQETYVVRDSLGSLDYRPRSL